MASRFSQSSVAALSNHFDDCSITDDVDLIGHHQRRDRDSETASSSYGNGTSTTTSMAYFPQTVVLCDLRHEAFEVRVPSASLTSSE